MVKLVNPKRDFQIKIFLLIFIPTMEKCTKHTYFGTFLPNGSEINSKKLENWISAVVVPVLRYP